MAQNVTFYTNNSDDRKLNKSLTQIASATVLLKDSNEIVNPHIIVNTSSISNWNAVNYIYIPDFKRYYFITNIQLLQGGRIEIDCHVDVLMSYKSEINSVSGIVKRSSNNGNSYLVDDKLKTLAKHNFYYYSFSNKFNQSLTYLLTVCG